MEDSPRTFLPPPLRFRKQADIPWLVFCSYPIRQLGESCVSMQPAQSGVLPSSGPKGGGSFSCDHDQTVQLLAQLDVTRKYTECHIEMLNQNFCIYYALLGNTDTQRLLTH